MKRYNILILGSGGREHSIAWSLHKDKNVKKIFCAPGNAGTLSIAKNVSINIMDNKEILSFIKKSDIEFIIVGPEQPLENGVVDYFISHGIKIFGPSKFASQLETSKLFARNIMEEYNIPQPAFFECVYEEDIWSVRDKISLPLVLKADGLAAGKGVIICKTEDELRNGIEVMVNSKKFGEASKKISVEECLLGEEVSVFVICDGEHYKIINSAQDHKRIFDDDLGPNTGGMGAYSPAPLFNKTLQDKTEKTIIKPILSAMRDKGHSFKGFLYVGLMIVDNDPYVIEFNVRLGDPEAQVLLPLLKSSLFDMMLSSINGEINNYNMELEDGFAVAIVLAAKGYPEKYNKGMLIKGLNNLRNEIVFHAGTTYKNNKYYCNGGRVLNVLGRSKNLNTAISNAYYNVSKIDFEDKYYRKDIGFKAMKDCMK